MKLIHRSRRDHLVAAFGLATIFLALPAAAQEQQPPQAGGAPTTGSTTPDKSKDEQTAKPSNQQSGTSNDRLFWTLPNFLTMENADKIPPLTSGQKFKVVARSSFDYVEYPYIGFLAGISQAENSEPGFGQGASGYGKRYMAAFADNSIENFMVGAVFPSLLRQDPRYYQLEKGGFWHRTGYSVSRIFVTRTDSGKNQFNFSEIVGSAVSAGISNSYHPAGDRTFPNTLSVWGTQVGWDTVAIVVREFWPDIRRKLQKEKK
jgi:hypothetical protein